MFHEPALYPACLPPKHHGRTWRGGMPAAAPFYSELPTINAFQPAGFGRRHLRRGRTVVVRHRRAARWEESRAPIPATPHGGLSSRLRAGVGCSQKDGLRFSCGARSTSPFKAINPRTYSLSRLSLRAAWGGGRTTRGLSRPCPQAPQGTRGGDEFTAGLVGASGGETV